MPHTPQEPRDLEKIELHNVPDDKAQDKADAKAHTEHQLDHGLKETFPASDPVSINPGAD